MARRRVARLVMSKMGCVCGAIISDVVGPCATEGEVLGDQPDEQFYRDFTASLTGFLEAVREGRRDAWLIQKFGEIYPRDLPDSEVIGDILMVTRRPYILSIAECGACGRLHVQRAPELNQYVTFAPDVPGFHRILARRSVDGRTAPDVEDTPCAT